METGLRFRRSVISADENFLIVVAIDKKNNNKDGLAVYDANTGEFISKMSCYVKSIGFLVPMPTKPNLVAVVSAEKCVIVDFKAKQKVRTIERWDGNITKNGKYGIYAPSRGGLELIDVRKGTSVKTFIPKVAEGIVSVICLFTENDEYVCYYHTSRKTIRVFRISDAVMIANYRLQADLTAIKSSKDGRSLVLGTVDGCLSVLIIADPSIEAIADFLYALPSRNEDTQSEGTPQNAEEVK